MRKTVKYGLIIVIIVGILASFTVAADRMQAENLSDSTMMTMEWSQISDTAARNDMTLDETLDYFQNYNGQTLYTGIVYKEPAFSDLEASGLITIQSGNEFSQQVQSGNWQMETEDVKVSDTYNYIVCSNENIMNMVFDNIKIKTDAVAQKISVNDNGNEILLVGTSLPFNDFSTLGTGFPKENMQILADHGLSVVVQVRSWPNADQESINRVFDDLAEWDNITAVGFNDENLPGVSQNDWQDISKMLAEKFEEYQWPLLQSEFFKQKGLSTLAKLLDYHVARMHTVTTDEIPKISESSLVDRFQLAANERGMNIMLYRTNPSLSAEDNAVLLEKIDNAITSKGRELGKMVPMDSVAVPVWVGLLAALGIGAGGVLLLEKFSFKKWSYILPAVCVVGSWAAIFLGYSHLMYKLLALASVMIFPTLSIITFIKAESRGLLKSILALLAMTAVSLIGAVFVVGLLSSRDYMTAISTFSGIKVSQMLPLLVLALFYWYQTNRLKGYDRNVVVMVRDVLKKPVTIGVLLILAFAAGILLLYMLRSGNDAVTVSSWEKAFRSFLDSTLGVRPRTKEFAFAHPLMLLALYYGYKNNLWPAVVLGGIGQVSLVNTFEHLHTPLAVSLLRTLNGLLLGIIIGVVLIFIAKAVLKWLNNKLNEPAS
ncbi:MAG: DUF5693 family protein [Bacillota bacterium]|jgi:hypothetical protein